MEVTALTYADDDRDLAPREVRGELTTVPVPTLGYDQYWVGGVQVDPSTVRPVPAGNADANPEDEREYHPPASDGELVDPAEPGWADAGEVYNQAAEGAPDAQPRDANGRWTGGGLGGKVARVGVLVDKAKAVAAALDGKAEGAGAAGKGYKGLKKVAHALESVMMVGMVRTQAVAAQAARERGLGEEHVERVAKVMAAVDFMASFGSSKLAAVATGGNPVAGFAAGMMPTGSLAYLAYSTARDPLATVRAARKYAQGKVPLPGKAHAADAPPTGNAEVPMATTNADPTADLLLGYFAEAADPDWATAVLLTCLDEREDGDVPGAVAAARAVLAAQPSNPTAADPQPEED